MSTKLWRALVLLAVVLAFGTSFEMLRQVIGSHSPWLILLLMFYVLAVFKMAEPLFMLRLPRALQLLRQWELEGTLYRQLGVVAYGHALRGSPLQYLNRAVYLDRAPRDLGRLGRQAEAAEAAHLLAGALVLPYMVYAALAGRWLVAVGFAVAELLVNAYPLLHLRYTRGRLQRVEQHRWGAQHATRDA